MKEKAFKKISTKRGAILTTNLYMTGDYLLLERKSGFSGRYRRFFYDDIISIITYQTQSWKVKILVLIAISIAISLLFKPFLGDFTTGSFRFFVFFNLLVWLVIINELIQGPTSESIIRTATTTDKIVIDNRYKKAKKKLQGIIETIESIQGGVDPSSLDEGSQEFFGGLSSTANPSEFKDQKPYIPSSKYNLLYSLFLAALFIEVLISLLQTVFRGEIYLILGIASSIVIIFNILVLFKQRYLSLRKSLQALAWISMGVFIVQILTSLVQGVFFSIKYANLPTAEIIDKIYSYPLSYIIQMVYIFMIASVLITGVIISIRGQHTLYTKYSDK